MADQEDVRRIALSLPETQRGGGALRLLGAQQGQAEGLRLGLERARRAEEAAGAPSRRGGGPRRRPSRQGGAARRPTSEMFFTEPHYNGFPAVLVRLPAVGLEQLEELIIDAWRCQAPRALVDAWLSGR